MLEENAVMALDDLLDATLDDLEDLPAFTPFPHGAYKVSASMSLKEIGTKTGVELELILLEVIEMANPEDVEPRPGDRATALYFLDNKFGVGNFKKHAIVFGAALGVSNNREIIEQTKSIECSVFTSTRADRNDPSKVYLEVKEVIIE